MSSLHAYRDEALARLRPLSDEELVAALNRETGSSAWTSTRGAYLVALHTALKERDLDLSDITNEKDSLMLKHPVRLEGRRVVQVLNT